MEGRGKVGLQAGSRDDRRRNPWQIPTHPNREIQNLSMLRWDVRMLGWDVDPRDRRRRNVPSETTE
jgi:hypothetical protein